MAKSIMVQGTASNAGKSLLAGALCRIFAQDGKKTAPFKSQNMALNSYITRDGREMGRAQVMQAQAAGVEPDVRMNPILLKPTGEKGSQVIVLGEVLGNMPAREYFAYKKKLIPVIQEAYDSLAKDYDLIVLEGAGSPAEINLKKDDIVNMGMAKLAKSPVILVADIDRGGVFASIAGTLLLLEPEEKAMVKGVVINKFRGDVEILRPGIQMIEEITGVPVLGVIPYTPLDIDDEDSLSSRLDNHTGGNLLTIGVVRFPRLSNFTDFNVFEMVQGVGVVYITQPSQLEQTDMIILPGSKNTIEDLLWMRQNGLEGAILKQAEKGKPIFGVCGGYQMLGEQISDPDGAEGGGTVRGMGLLPIDTQFSSEKTCTRTEGTFHITEGCFSCLNGLKTEGYEIHMGITDTFRPILKLEGEGFSRMDGCIHNNTAGCYLHGVFDSSEIVNRLAAMLLERKGLDTSVLQSFDLAAYRESQYDRLAEVVRQSLDMEAVTRIVEEGL